MVKQTAVLYKIRYAWLKKQEFARRGVYRVQPVPMNMKTSLEERHIVPEDPMRELIPKEKPWRPEEVPPEIPPDFRNTWHQKPQEEGNKELNYWLKNSTAFSAGVQQACLLTKTQMLDGLPQRVWQHVKAVENHPFYQKEKKKVGLYQIGIMQSQIWDPTMVKLPRRRDIENLQWVFRREFGIPHGKSAKILLNHLLYAAGHLSESYPELVKNSQIIYKPEVELNYDYLGNNIIIRAINECMTYGAKPLPPFLSKEFIEQSRDYTIPPMDPLLPTIDLEETDRTISDSCGALVDVSGLRCPHAQTIYRATGNIRKPQTVQAYNLMLSFAVAATEAKQRFNITKGVLPEPIVIQNVNLTYNKLHFVFFQLNTLDTHTKDGVKNFVWFDQQTMFKKILPKPWKEKNRRYMPTQYVDLMMEPFKLFLATYLNGVSELEPHGK